MRGSFFTLDLLETYFACSKIEPFEIRFDD
jgi:hypothetical protein